MTRFIVITGAPVMDLNVRPALQLTQAFLPGMRSARFGRIINVTSLVTRSNNPRGSEGEVRYQAKAPVQRFAQPSEIAAAIAFLAGQTAAFITGQTLFVDGGASLGSLQPRQ
jgi:3-oxoacyl-[acyl-carrier protein] reductase